MCHDSVIYTEYLRKTCLSEVQLTLKDGNLLLPTFPLQLLEIRQHMLWISFNTMDKILRYQEHLPWPFSNAQPRSTLTLDRVCPCDLWMERAHASINGTCIRSASILLRSPSTVKSTGAHSNSISLVNLTNGHLVLLGNIWSLSRNRALERAFCCSSIRLRYRSSSRWTVMNRG